MRLKIFLLSVVCPIYLAAQLPQMIWGKTFTTKVYTQSTAIDSAGNVYITGSFRDTIDFDPGPFVYNLTSPGNENSFVAKYSSQGNFIWAKHFQTSMYASGFEICVDDTGQVYVSGHFYSPCDFDPGPATYTLGASGGEIYIVKLDVNGNFKWAGTIGSPDYDWPHAIKLDHQGGLFITGIVGYNGPSKNVIDLDPGPGSTFDTTEGNGDGFLVKLDVNGNHQWSKTWGTWTMDAINSIDLAPNGDILLAGSTGWSMDMDPGPVTFSLGGTGGNGFIIKLNSNGAYQFARTWEGGTDKQGAKFDHNSNIVLHGAFYGTLDLDPGPATLTTQALRYSDGYVIKLSNSGSLIWAKTVHDSGYLYTHDLEIDGNNDLYLYGFAGCQSTDFDPGPGIDTVSGCGGYLWKLNANGLHQWVFSTKNTNTVWRPSIAVDPQKNIYCWTPANSVADLDPGPGTFTIGGNFAIHALLMKLAQPTNPTFMTDQQGSDPQLGIFPNPGSGKFMVRGLAEDESLSIRNNMGQLIFFIDHVKNDCLVDCNLPNGIYTVTTSKGKRTAKLVVASSYSR